MSDINISKLFKEIIKTSDDTLEHSAFVLFKDFGSSLNEHEKAEVINAILTLKNTLEMLEEVRASEYQVSDENDTGTSSRAKNDDLIQAIKRL